MQCSRTRGKKSDEHVTADDPPRARANKRRGRGTSANDRPPSVGTLGRTRGQVRLRIVQDTTQATVRAHVEQVTGAGTQVSTGEYESYAPIARSQSTVCHGLREWARDADGDGMREVYTNTCEGMWAGLRTYVRVFRGVHTRYLSGYVAVHACRVNRKAITAEFIAA